MFKKIIIATAVALSLGMPNTAQASTSTFADIRAVNEYLSPVTSTADKASMKPKVKQLIDKHKNLDEYYSHRLLFSIYSNKNSGFYSVFFAGEKLEDISTLKGGLFAGYALKYYSDQDSVFYNPKRVTRLSVSCAEAGDKECILNLYDSALLDANNTHLISSKIKSNFVRMMDSDKATDRAKYIYARSVGTGLAIDNGNADKSLKEAAKNLHLQSLTLVIGLYKEGFYTDSPANNLFFYSYLKAVSTNNLTRDSIGEIFQYVQAVNPIDQKRLLTEANDILSKKKILIPHQFRTP
ncbi:hypothetical protein LMH73_007890 [Vibrio splendidus]|nr:hypothetical protein [Vibrio splendidus]MCC4883110.1 hypothetical protein [Vibrio splendidus]